MSEEKESVIMVTTFALTTAICSWPMAWVLEVGTGKWWGVPAAITVFLSGVISWVMISAAISIWSRK